MKGPKIENIRDPKWIGKKIIVGELSVSPDKLVFVGNGQICTENRFKSLSLWPIDCYDWYEWIEFPFKVGDKIRNRTWLENTVDYIELVNINKDKFEISIYPDPDHCFRRCPGAIRIDILKNTSEWEIYMPLKKKKTVAFALVKNSKDSFRLSELAYVDGSENSEIIKRHRDTIQFPAVTKDGTVLEFEVDDD